MEEDFEMVRTLDGLHVGLLDDAEREAFNRLCESGHAMRSYGGVGGFMGLAKVRLRRGPLGLD